MSKFKIGDKVMVVSRFKDSWYGEEHFNRIFTIKEIHRTYCTFEELDEYGGFVLDHIKHAAQSPKSMLQNGMRVKLRNGLLYTYIDGYFTNIKTKKGGLNYLSKVDEWGDNLSYYVDGEECMWDVMEIFAATEIYDYFSYEVETESLWKREEKSATQIELENLEQQAIDLAVRIKAIKEQL